jgi:(R,R)-butanediol dehydrogenase/meso-butanediol dehydrogenase/diacetyl reductase
MWAAKYYGHCDIRIEEVEEPQPRAGEVKVKVAHNGICGTDLHEYYAGANAIPVTPHPLTGISAPVIIGHEFSGTIVEVGDGVTTSSTGDRVAVRPTLTCGKCPACRRGLSHICQKLAFAGISASSGGLSEFVVIPAENIHTLPEQVSLELGALVEPMAVSYHAIARSRATSEDAVVILGAGPIGIGLYLALAAQGYSRIVVSEVSAERRNAISALGAEHVIDPTEQDLASTVRTLSDGDGAAAVFDAAGAGAAFDSGLPTLAPRGQMIVVALHEHAFSFNPSSLLLQENEVLTSCVYDDADYSAVIQHMATGAYDTSGWVEHAPMNQLHEAYEDLRAGRKVKVLIDL